MARQICVTLSLTGEEKAILDDLRKRLACSRTEVLQLALRQFLDHYQEEKQTWKSGASAT